MSNVTAKLYDAMAGVVKGNHDLAVEFKEYFLSKVDLDSKREPDRNFSSWRKPDATPVHFPNYDTLSTWCIHYKLPYDRFLLGLRLHRPHWFPGTEDIAATGTLGRFSGWLIDDQGELYRQLIEKMRAVREGNPLVRRLGVAALSGLGKVSAGEGEAPKNADLFAQFDEELKLWANPETSKRGHFKMLADVHDGPTLARVEELFRTGEHNRKFYLHAFWPPDEARKLLVLCPLLVGQHVFIAFDDPESHRPAGATYFELEDRDTADEVWESVFMSLWSSFGDSKSLYRLKDQHNVDRGRLNDLRERVMKLGNEAKRAILKRPGIRNRG